MKTAPAPRRETGEKPSPAFCTTRGRWTLGFSSHSSPQQRRICALFLYSTVSRPYLWDYKGGTWCTMRGAYMGKEGASRCKHWRGRRAHPPRLCRAESRVSHRRTDSSHFLLLLLLYRPKTFKSSVSLTLTARGCVKKRREETYENSSSTQPIYTEQWHLRIFGKTLLRSRRTGSLYLNIIK